jgi:hypothetical protein
MSTYPVFNPEEFFHYASLILHDPLASEAQLRTAISRSYYSLFLIARDKLFGTDEHYLTSGIRKKILKSYQIRIDKKKKHLATHELVIYAINDKTHNVTLFQQLDQLREARVNADYKMSQKLLADLGKKSWRDYAEENMQLAALVLARVKTLSSY